MLEFNEVYVLTNSTKNFMPVPQLVFGTKTVKDSSSELGADRTVVRFLVPSDVSCGHEIYVDSMDQDGKAVVVKDALRRGDADGGTVLWRFEILDEANWASMRDHVIGYEAICDLCPTVAAVREYYLQQWLDNDWWTEN